MSLLPLYNHQALRGLQSIPIRDNWACDRDEFFINKDLRYIVCHPFAKAQLAAYIRPVDREAWNDWLYDVDSRRPDVDAWLEGVEEAVIERAHARLTKLMFALTEANILDRVLTAHVAAAASLRTTDRWTIDRG